MPPLQFQPISSQPSPAFWSALNALKLDKLKLEDAQQPITAWLEEGKSIVDKENKSAGPERDVGVDGVLGVGGSAFGGEGDRAPAGSLPIRGVFKNFNTIEQFKSTDEKKAIFDQVADSIYASFELDEPDLHQFLLVTFADLKKYVYQYWFAFPALVSKPGWDLDAQLSEVSEEDIQEARSLEPASSSTLGALNDGYLMRGPAGQREAGSLGQATSFFASTPKEEASSFILSGVAWYMTDNQRWIVFHDPSSLAQNPGWPLRNILFYLAHKHSISSINILCLRSGSASRQGRVALHDALETGKPTAVGWERNKAGKLASRVADLGPMLDPARLADQAVDLNLKLMRWRIMPSLDLEKVAATRCLLLGAGTLGCYVARSLMGWGIRNITFVDSARVSYSNPVRQPLFDFEDCLDGGKPKAQCAADRLRKIFPGVNAQAHSFMIPMPGHPIPPSSAAQSQADVKKLESLIESHDAVFLLMDSRESRWLPTVIGAAKSKIVINAALGFDSYLVMRHGAAPGVQKAEERLGCYYCNDVVAPTDSLTDRTLDQMCTVTRPGIAPIASATAVELLTSLLQHPLGLSAPAEGSANATASAEEGSCLGLVPHQLRGGLSSWKTTLIKGEAYPQCTACSPTVIEAYREQGWSMLKRAFDETGYLEKLTGLDKLQEESDRRMRELEEMDEGSEEDDF